MEMEDGRLAMSGTTAETAVVMGTGENCRRVASRETTVGHAQAIIICGIGVALSWTNGKQQDALGDSRDESLAPSVFFAASVMKAFGLLLALYFAQKALWNGDNDFGSGGPPIMMIWGTKSTGEHPGKHAAVMSGFVLQAIGIWTPLWDRFFGENLGATIGRYVVYLVVVLFWIVYVAPTVRYFQVLLGDPEQMCPVHICVKEKREFPARALSSALTLLVLMGPVALYTLESVFIFLSESAEPAAYILAVLDLVTVVLALPFLGSFVTRVVPQLWGGEWTGRTVGWARV